MTTREELVALADELRAFLDRSTMNSKADEFLRKVENALRLASRQEASVTAPTHAMLLAGARSIGNTAHEQNHMERARACWCAMQSARDGIEEPKP